MEKTRLHKETKTLVIYGCGWVIPTTSANAYNSEQTTNNPKRLKRTIAVKVGKRTIMKATQMNAIAREIRNNRNGFDAILNDFRVYWGKVYRKEVTKVLNDVNEQLKADPKNADLKAFRYALETVCAKIKGVTVSKESENIIRSMHDDDKLTFSCLRLDYIVEALKGLNYVNENGELCELRKKDKDAIEKTWEPVVRWTESKVGKYFRLATVRLNEESK